MGPPPRRSSRASAPRGSAGSPGVGSGVRTWAAAPWIGARWPDGKISKIGNFFQNVANFWRARSRLYQNETLQKKYAFDSIFQALQDLHPFAPLQSQNFRKKSV